MTNSPRSRETSIKICGSLKLTWQNDETSFRPAETLKGLQPMTTEFALRNAAERAYLAAFLLTVNSQLAEAAVMKCIRDMDPDQASDEALFDTALQTAIELGRSGEFDTLTPETAFPLELQSVANLPPLPRQVS